MSSTTHLVSLALAWGLYGLIHSLLASNTAKTLFQRSFPEYFRGYRLGFNLLAGVFLVPPLWLLFTYPGELLWHWPQLIRWIADAAAVLAVIGFLLSLKSYDTSEFLGISQLRASSVSVNDQAPMSLSWAHRFVRHPWYFLGLVIIWTREMNAALLVTAVVLTLYLLVGSRQEEKKLITCYGRQYDKYRRSVPALFPLPWRHLSKQDAQEILAMRNGRDSTTSQ